MFARRLFLLALVLATLLLTGLASSWLTGCASLTAGVDWDEYPTHKPLPAHIVRVDDVTAQCRGYPRFTTLACAMRDYDLGICTIYVDRDPQPSTIWHELKHCAGFDHEVPGIPRSR